MKILHMGMWATALTLLLATPAAAQLRFTATMDGAQEVPPVVTEATGTGTFTLLPNDMLVYHIEFSGLSANESAAGFYGPAVVGGVAESIYSLTSGSPKDGEFGPLDVQEKSDLMSGLWYVNIHSTNNAGGEIRGQLLLSTVGTETGSIGEIKIQFEN